MHPPELRIAPAVGASDSATKKIHEDSRIPSSEEVEGLMYIFLNSGLHRQWKRQYQQKKIHEGSHTSTPSSEEVEGLMYIFLNGELHRQWKLL